MVVKVLSMQDRLTAPVEEAYKVLRTNIQFCGFDKKIKTLTVTSCNPGEGKTTTAFNLARTMAKSEMRVLLIDADLRKPMVAQYAGGSNKCGLSNLVSGQVKFEDVVSKTIQNNFHFIACGPKPPNPAELISSRKFKEILETAAQQYDMVIIDTPPLGSVIDSAIIASQTDGTLLVVQAKAVEYRHLLRVKEQLNKANANIIGVVLNKIEKGELKNYYNYYNYYGKTDKADIGLNKKIKAFKRAEV